MQQELGGHGRLYQAYRETVHYLSVHVLYRVTTSWQIDVIFQYLVDKKVSLAP